MSCGGPPHVSSDLGSCPLRARSHGKPPALAGRRSQIVHRNTSLLNHVMGRSFARRYSGLVWWCDPRRNCQDLSIGVSHGFWISSLVSESFDELALLEH